jgi:nucleolar protein 9
MDSAIRLQAGFDSVRKALLDAFAIDHKQPAKTIRCLLSMRPLSQLTAPPNINNHSSNVIGSQLIQKFLQFPENCNVFLVSSLFAQTIEELLEMARDPAASRALEAFFTSPAVGEKVKRKVLRSLEGRFVDLAQNKYACHLVDRCWSVADIKQKVFC